MTTVLICAVLTTALAIYAGAKAFRAYRCQRSGHRWVTTYVDGEREFVCGRCKHTFSIDA